MNGADGSDVVIFEKQKKIVFIGGDKRQIYLAQLMEKMGFTVNRLGIIGAENNCKNPTEALTEADALILPIPVTRDGYKLNSATDITVSELAMLVPSGCMVLGGGIPPAVKDFLAAEGIHCTDFFDSEEYLWRNADITAEGAISLLMGELDRTVKGTHILICGFGRIGKCLAVKLSRLGACVTVAARRKSDRLVSELLCDCDADSIDYCREGIFDLSNRYEAVFNTVPGWMFDKTNSVLTEAALYFELASSPYGCEAEFMKNHCKKYILASGLPGKYAPLSAAEAMLSALQDCFGKEIST